MTVRCCVTADRVWLMRASTNVTAMLRRAAIVERRLSLLLRRLTVKIRDAIRIGRCSLWLIVVPLEIIWMTVLTTGRLGNVRYDLHATWNDTCRSAASRRIS